MLRTKDIENQRELLQNDITCILDGVDNSVVDNVCQAITDRMNLLIMLHVTFTKE